MSDISYPTVKDWLDNLELKKEVETRTHPLTGEQEKINHYILSIEIAASCSVSEKDEKSAPEILKVMREQIEHAIEKEVDSLVFNKISQHSRSGFYETPLMVGSVVVIHPVDMVEVLKHHGAYTKYFDVSHSSPTTVKEEVAE